MGVYSRKCVRQESYDDLVNNWVAPWGKLTCNPVEKGLAALDILTVDVHRLKTEVKIVKLRAKVSLESD